MKKFRIYKKSTFYYDMTLDIIAENEKEAKLKVSNFSNMDSETDTIKIIEGFEDGDTEIEIINEEEIK